MCSFVIVDLHRNILKHSHLLVIFVCLECIQEAQLSQRQRTSNVALSYGAKGISIRDLHGNFPQFCHGFPREIPRLREQNVRVTRGKVNKY